MIYSLKVYKNILFLIFIFCIGFNQFGYTQKLKTKHIIEIKNMMFIPAELTIQKGDTVVWINRDIFPHDVTEFKNKIWSSSILQQGKSWYKVFSKNEDYHCSLHIVMRGKIIVN